MDIKLLPSAEFLHQCFLYNPETGSLKWKERPAAHFNGNAAIAKTMNACYANKEAGSLMNSGHKSVGLTPFRKLLVHRVIYKMMTGEDPPLLLDHKNGIPDDNRWENIRNATYNQNGHNRGARRDNRSGLRGVYWRKDTKKYFSRICVNGKVIGLGCFDSASEAHAAFNLAAKKYYGAYAHIEPPSSPIASPTASLR